jgi:hypothetical protein
MDQSILTGIEHGALLMIMMMLFRVERKARIKLERKLQECIDKRGDVKQDDPTPEESIVDQVGTLF